MIERKGCCSFFRSGSEYARIDGCVDRLRERGVAMRVRLGPRLVLVVLNVRTPSSEAGDGSVIGPAAGSLLSPLPAVGEGSFEASIREEW